MPVTIRFGPEGPLNCRFAHSPSWETQAAVRALRHGGHPGAHASWVRRNLPVARTLGLEPLWLLMPRRGSTPDFLAPAAPSASFAAEVARMRATEPARAHAEIAESLASTPGAAASPAGRALLADPAAAVETLAAAVVRAWEALVAPEWPRLRALLDADIAFQARRLTDGGLATLFAELHPQVSWQAGALRIDRPPRHTRELTGDEGVTLMPSVFGWPDVAAGFAPPAPAALVYPARGIGGLWNERPTPPPESLARLLGARRAAVLTALDEPACTTVLATRLALAPSTVSAHLAALRAAGLLHSYRVRHQVRYARTPLGDALRTGGDPTDPGGRWATTGP